MSTPAFAAARRLLSRRDPVLKAVIARVGPCTLQPVSDDPLTILVRCVVFQQLSTAAGRTIFTRLADKVGGMPFAATRLAKLSEAELRECGLSGAKTRAVAAILEYAADPARLSGLATAADEDIRSALVSIKGVGPWTADMFLMFGLVRPDVFPTGDLGVRSAIRNLYGLSELPTPEQMHAVGDKWKPHRTVASWYLWRSLDGPATV